MKRAAIYLRVSSEAQTYENQRPDVERIIATRGYNLVKVYEEQASAVRSRPAFSTMMNDAHRGLFDVLVLWALDRFGRTMVGNMQAVLDLDRKVVTVISVREPWLDTSGAVRSLLIAIFSWIAEQEREQIVARTVAGMERARKKGVHLGRPIVHVDVKRALSLKAKGLTLAQIASHLHVSLTTLKRALHSA